MNPQDFNRKMAELEGFEIDSEYPELFVYFPDEAMPRLYDPYNDLNLMMPLAWKHGIDPVAIGIKSICDNGKANTKKEQTEAIRQCLIKIYEDTKT